MPSRFYRIHGRPEADPHTPEGLVDLMMWIAVKVENLRRDIVYVILTLAVMALLFGVGAAVGFAREQTTIHRTQGLAVKTHDLVSKIEGQQKAIEMQRQEIRDGFAAADLRLCEALAAARAINNRDRVTLIREIAALRRDVAVAASSSDLRRLEGQIVLLVSELAQRPHLTPLRCLSLPSLPKSKRGRARVRAAAEGRGK